MQAREEPQHQGVLTGAVLAPTPGQLDGGSRAALGSRAARWVVKVTRARTKRSRKNGSRARCNRLARSDSTSRRRAPDAALYAAARRPRTAACHVQPGPLVRRACGMRATSVLAVDAHRSAHLRSGATYFLKCVARRGAATSSRYSRHPNLADDNSRPDSRSSDEMR